MPSHKKPPERIRVPKPKVRRGWGTTKPVTRVIDDKRRSRRDTVKSKLRKGKYDEVS